MVGEGCLLSTGLPSMDLSGEVTVLSTLHPGGYETAIWKNCNSQELVVELVLEGKTQVYSVAQRSTADNLYATD